MTLEWITTTLVLVLSTQASATRLQGRVTDLFGFPAPGVTISVSTTSGLAVGAGTSDGTGAYSIAVRDHHGPAQVKASLTGFVTSERTMVLYPGNNVWDVGLAVGRLADPIWRTVSGTVVGPDGKAVVGATITLNTLYGLNEVERLRSDDRGAFDIRVGDPVPYVLVVSKPGHAGHATVVDIGDKLKTSIRITLGAPSAKSAGVRAPR